ncbi:SH3 domain-containing protein [Sphingomonas sp. S1-29]|uniref:SH3 domain-containing protein n=1 Tax=Sphingomonas sp. S1-29 TaxID=2991074 RepID=UPI00224027F9|nr:SH3 domain-containing protein [Sphingomonas sp. S1-29]UZK69247.1 SH3 domain-containing protein [Sphingomonas sp. S1-29]
MSKGGLAATAITLALIAAPVSAQQRKPPYYASIAASKARMRTGPGRNYPVNWVYVRADLPIRVIDIYRDWRKVESADGTSGWMQVGLLSDRRTGIVQGGITELRESADAGARVAWRVAPGVVGRIIGCARGWCRIDIKGRGGYIEQARLWGVAPDEDVD